MNSLKTIQIYPMTGTQSLSIEATEFCSNGGLRGDRELVAYDSSQTSDEGFFKRISAKQAPRMLGLISCRGGDTYTGDNFNNQIIPIDYGVSEQPISIDEFGDETIAYDLGDVVASNISNYLGKNFEHVRVAMVDSRPDKETRAVAPIHLASVASVEYVANELELDYSEVVNRFRLNFVVEDTQDDSPFSELYWDNIVVGNLGNVIKIHRQTVRCPVPGFDSSTGDRIGDIPKLYRSHFPKDAVGGKLPVFGVYGYHDANSNVEQSVKINDIVLINKKS